VSAVDGTIDRWLDHHAIRLDPATYAPDPADVSRLATIDAALANTRLVFLGETNHFIHEKTDFRLWWLHRLALRHRLVVGEELGLIGTTVILTAFLAIAWRGLRAALVAPDRFGALLALGITAMVACQALVNMSVVIGLFPTKGIPLPFVSNGGSSLLINLVGMGILLNISQQASPVAAAAVDAAGGELVNV